MPSCDDIDAAEALEGLREGILHVGEAGDVGGHRRHPAWAQRPCKLAHRAFIHVDQDDPGATGDERCHCGAADALGACGDEQHLSRIAFMSRACQRCPYRETRPVPRTA